MRDHNLPLSKNRYLDARLRQFAKIRFYPDRKSSATANYTLPLNKRAEKLMELQIFMETVEEKVFVLLRS